MHARDIGVDQAARHFCDSLKGVSIAPSVVNLLEGICAEYLANCDRGRTDRYRPDSGA
jgi:hypothetical protein